MHRLFRRQRSDGGQELWRSDGTAAGTYRVEGYRGWSGKFESH